MQKALFLDRDGVINKEKNYLYKIEDFEFCEGIFDLLKHCQSLEYIFIIITNQSGIRRGYYAKQDFEKLTSWMIKEFEKEGITLSQVYHCPHKPEDNCDCRKPKTGMIETAKKDFNIDLSNSWLIGDKPSDIKAGIDAGISNTVLINSFICKEAKYSVKSLFDIIKLIN